MLFSLDTYVIYHLPILKLDFHLETLDPDVAIPNRPAVVLQSYMAETCKVLQGATEFVLCVIRIFVRSCPKVQIHIDDLLTVEHYLDATAFAGKRAAVPLAWFFNHVLRRFEAIVYCSGSAFLVDPIPAV